MRSHPPPPRELLAAREVIDRESADHESFTAMEPALLLELEDVQKGLEETRSESAGFLLLPATKRQFFVKAF